MKFTGGLPETRCGAGSKLGSTYEIREAVPVLLRRLGAKTMLDAPCGDFNWMAHTNLTGIEYTGYDTDLRNVFTAMNKSSRAGFAPSSKTIRKVNVVMEDLPKVDVILCRDFLQHLTTSNVKKCLNNFAKAEPVWFLITSHKNEVNEDIASDGDFRPLNLLRPPFDFPDPVMKIPDGGNFLCLWRNRTLL